MEEVRQSTRRSGTAARRQELLDAALDCFVENGFDGTSLRQIAMRARMTHAGLLHHFESKEALVAALLQRRDERDKDLAKEFAVVSGGEGRAPALLKLLAHHRTAPGEMRFWSELFAAASRPEHPSRNYYVSRYDHLRAQVEAVLRKRAESGALREGVQPELIAMLLPAVLDGLQSQWLLEQTLPIDPAVEHFLGFLLKEGARLDGAALPAAPDRPVNNNLHDATLTPAAPTVPADRRQPILAAAVALFASNGFGGASISEVAAKAGCSKASVLYHFATKDELLQAALQPLVAALDGLLATLRSTPPALRTKGGVPALVELCVRHRSLMALLAALPLEGGAQRLVPAWVNGSLVEMLAENSAAGRADFTLAAIPAFCRQSAGLTDQALREHLTATLSVLLGGD